ncbi:hypothetical protein PR202_ga14232 [Eleusine coracana subsp. coracana]|uniref:Pseudouridine-5'-phosphate glycosidase n=1 Tax=Eleusine coracana subsp. coracana TaxID=191504 RepID=A0AAV5CG18_ELECO|nr:hypothetical protein PR202_ga14232 [Eleusine coracana subsp. coracana]
MSTGVAVAPEVTAALARGGAVVALESTIISHGMPYPKNLQTAMEVEAIVRENGAVPATIAILDGVPHVAMDISSDLTELGKTPVAVISAGVKSILDIPRTLEYLETQGVTVAAYRTNEFPAFFTEVSGSQVPCRVDSPEECARIIFPVPKQHAASGNIIESAIQKALKEAGDKGIIGNAITPFMLERVKELTGGSSLEAIAFSKLQQGKTNRLGRSAL